MSDKERDELIELESIARAVHNQPFQVPPNLWPNQIALAILAAGYTRPRTVTEYGIVFNGHASGLVPPALSLEEFKERYPNESYWAITDRDVYIQRTRQEVDPALGAWELMPTDPTT